MTPPKARCVTCNTVIATHDPTKTHQRPKFCDDPVCRAIYKKNPVCVRCHGPITLGHMSQRYHEGCAEGCKFCGGAFDNTTVSVHRPKRTKVLPPTYCSKECRNNAWADQPMPTCPACELPVTFDQDAFIYRDPPLYHHGCRPDSARHRRKRMVSRVRETSDFAYTYRKAHECPDGFTIPLTRPRPPPVPWDLDLLCELPEYPPDGPDEWWDDYLHEEPSRGSWALERDIVDTHPDKPLRERVSDYSRNEDVYRRKYVMVEPWANPQGTYDLNPTHTL